MPVSGSNRWTIRAKLIDGTLTTQGRAYMSQAYVDDVDETVKRLLDGEEVPLYQYFPFLQAVTDKLDDVTHQLNQTGAIE